MQWRASNDVSILGSEASYTLARTILSCLGNFEEPIGQLTNFCVNVRLPFLRPVLSASQVASAMLFFLMMRVTPLTMDQPSIAPERVKELMAAQHF
jgi:hypothetical protein